MLFEREHTVLVLIDLQKKLFDVMVDKELLADNVGKLVAGARVLGIPIINVEQYPQGLGATIAEVKEQIPDYNPIVKDTFSAGLNQDFIDKLQSLNCNQVIVAGIETHICVYQTVIHLLEDDYEVQVVTDATSARNINNKQVGLDKMVEYGADLTSVEMVLFELLELAQGDEFKQIIKIVK